MVGEAVSNWAQCQAIAPNSLQATFYIQIMWLLFLLLVCGCRRWKFPAFSQPCSASGLAVYLDRTYFSTRHWNYIQRTVSLFCNILADKTFTVIFSQLNKFYQQIKSKKIKINKLSILACERQGVVDVNTLFLAADCGQIHPLFVYWGADWLQQLLWDCERATSGWLESDLIRSGLRLGSESVSAPWTAALIRSLPKSLKMNQLTNISSLTHLICS